MEGGQQQQASGILQGAHLWWLPHENVVQVLLIPELHMLQRHGEAAEAAYLQKPLQVLGTRSHVSLPTAIRLYQSPLGLHRTGEVGEGCKEEGLRPCSKKDPREWKKKQERRHSLLARNMG